MRSKAVTFFYMAVVVFGTVSCSIAHGATVVCMASPAHSQHAYVCTCTSGHMVPASCCAHGKDPSHEHGGCMCADHVQCAQMLPCSYKTIGNGFRPPGQQPSHGALAHVVVCIGARSRPADNAAHDLAARAVLSCLRTSTIRV